MTDGNDNRSIHTLLDICSSLERMFNDHWNKSFWIKAEMNKLNRYPHSGHCYPDLIEKQGDKVVAELRAILWKSDFEHINKRFLEITKEPLKDGIKILLLGKLQYTPKYGLSLRIQDIDPSYTLGDLEREKKEAIAKLKAEGAYFLNKGLKLALVPKRIAIISVETSKGYQDFLNVIEAAIDNWGYRFIHRLFPSVLQGEGAVGGIIGQLEQIRGMVDQFDAVAIIRGGGGETGLACYNHFDLSKTIATFPIPVITGIGHSTNETVSEMVAFKNAITPTKLAEFLIQQFHNFSVPVKEARQRIIDLARRMIADENERFNAEVKKLDLVTKNTLSTQKGKVENQSHRLGRQANFMIEQQKDKVELVPELLQNGMKRLFVLLNNHLDQKGRTLSVVATSVVNQKQNLLTLEGSKIEGAADRLLLSKNRDLSILDSTLNKETQRTVKREGEQLAVLVRNLKNLSPQRILERGYSITQMNGKAVRNVDKLKEGDELATVLANGLVRSRVEETKAIEDNE